jgi:hypothetical protein
VVLLQRNTEVLPAVGGEALVGGLPVLLDEVVVDGLMVYTSVRDRDGDFFSLDMFGSGDEEYVCGLIRQ